MQHLKLHDTFIHNSFNLSKLGYNIVFKMLKMIGADDERGKRYRIEKLELIKMLDLKGGSAYNRLRKTFVQLEKDGYINVADNPEQNEDGVRIFSNLTNEANSSFIEFELHPKMHRFLFALKSSEYTTIDLEQIFKFKSLYSRRIYLLLKVWKNETVQFYDLDQFRKMLAIPENQYKNFAILRSRVLEKAKKDLAGSDRPFNYEGEKSGKKVYRIKVSIKAANVEKTENKDPLIVQMVNQVDKSYNKQTVKIEHLQQIIREAYADQSIKVRTIIETNIQKATNEGSLLFYAEKPDRIRLRFELMATCGLSQLNANKILARLSYEEVNELVTHCLTEIKKSKAGLRNKRIDNPTTWSYRTIVGKYNGIFDSTYEPFKQAA